MCTRPQTLTPCVLELGGKDAFILCEDADMGVAVPTALRGSFQNSGQNCVGIERIYAYEGVYDAFVDAAVARVQRMRQGPPIDESTGAYREVDIGCITTAPQLAIMQELVDDAVAKGAVLHCGGRVLYRGGSDAAAAAAVANGSSSSNGKSAAASPSRNGSSRRRASAAQSTAAAAAKAGTATTTTATSPSSADLSTGLFYPPTVLSGVTHDMRIANEEVFGPIMTIIKVAGNNDDAAVAMANSTAYGLGATVFSANTRRADAIAGRLRSGMVGVNAFGLNYLVQDLPFGGVGASGYDRFSGPEGLRSCCLVRSVVTDILPGIISIPTPIPAPLVYPIAPSAADFTLGLLGVLHEEGGWAKTKALGRLLRAL